MTSPERLIKLLKYVIAIAIIVVIVGLYLWSYAINAKTEKPEGCEDVSCSGCAVDNCATRR